MDRLPYKVAEFIFSYPFLTLGLAFLVFYTFNLMLRFGEPVTGEVDAGSVVALLILAAIFTPAGIDVRRLWGDRTNG